MSVCAAIWSRSRSQCWIGSDTIFTHGDFSQPGRQKWIVKKPWAVGITGGLRAMLVLEAHVEELFSQVKSPYDFATTARGLLKRDGYISASNAGPEMFGQAMILAHPSGLWSICEGFSVAQIEDGVAFAIGSGADFAIGVGNAVKGGEKQRLREAISSAMRWSSTCGGSIWIKEIKG